ncbi:3-keto-5-aminohexanoate cleavage protein [Lujinxingia vulgaris]|uniref:3-keto-5-aminohexanoate cleavage protein n=1 Tax=Lujinxingia vulgaris TaxID=2600176 RepID=A0A5C6XE59_9DELT|nr:3-keto-5-aminohexanoate cleavage protein [Lujinxingia vulgaris]TXD38802.1 3-keto-5-aminohexanoate cleavage protein [Lujinxingia vulgaris]
MTEPTPLIITAAVVGAEVMREHTPHVPYTPVEIAEEAARCRQAGAAMVHVHGRLDDGTPTQDRATFETILNETRQRTDALVQFSTGGAVWMSVDERIEGLDLKPDMATLTTGTVNFGDDVFMNSLPMIRQIASRQRELGIVPEIEVFDTGMVDTALNLLKEGVVTAPLHFDFVLGVPGAMGARPENLRFLVEMLPDDATWSVAGIGRHQLPLAELAIAMGGHVRVGLEDNIYLSRGVLAKGSYELVERVAELAAAADRPLATPAQARQILQLDRFQQV